MGEEALLTLRGIRKSFGGTPVLRGIDLTVGPAEFLTFLGPSGCGKTTTLRLIAGFDQPDEGSIRLGGREMAGVPAYRRDVHTVFQHYALFPHYDIYENVAFGLRIRRLPEEEIRSRVSDALALVKLSGFESRRTSSLSGGQMQRIALARALVGRPSLLLLDEPLGALDLKLRKEMQLELKSLQKRLKIAFVYVTHDQEEAMTMSDRIAVFNHGAIEQLGTPEEIYRTPRTSFVADFMGSANILSAGVLPSRNGELRLRLEGEAEVVLPRGAPAAEGAGIKVAVRPESVSVRYEEPDEEEGVLTLKATLVDTVYLGNSSQIFLLPFSKPGKVLMAVSMDAAHHQPRPSGSTVWARIKAADLLPLEAEGASAAAG